MREKLAGSSTKWSQRFRKARSSNGPRLGRGLVLLLVINALVLAVNLVLIYALPTSVSKRAPEASPPIALGSTAGAAKIDEVTNKVGVTPSIVMWYQHWSGSPSFPSQAADAAVSRGAMPIVTWEPRDPRGGGAQPQYALRTIVAGEHDAYIRRWAQEAAAWGKPIYLRFAHEMNGDWYPWSSGVNGNTSAEYVSAWRHVHDVFRQEGATNVRWVWSPNEDGSTPFADVYPGDAYVDWVGIDGYNWGTTQEWSEWSSLSEIFGPAYRQLTTMTDKPMIIAETASTEVGGDKAAWIRQGLLKDLPSQFPRIRAVVWFDENKETSWSVNSSEAALAAYREAALSPLYSGQLK
jgi:hypothetical protein